MPDGSATLDAMGVCVACTTNVHLKAWIAGNGAPGACGFCGSEEHSVVDVAHFVDHVDGVIRRNYSPSDEDGDVAASVISTVAAFLVESYLFQRDRGLLHSPSKDRKG